MKRGLKRKYDTIKSEGYHEEKIVKSPLCNLNQLKLFIAMTIENDL
jgi:hypothetical protein